ncbi:unnamed protein product [Zymoseptoria tritici ST99CH_1E4]|uniref:D-xylose 1-dehydrogenase (NADP(+), D-xylono-1,5-lactone-forming) n=1 Tax=Zymoseptoria tritici ST99CH_1E4 TaxID=1276532 RepID=A0A2H1FPA1_ZYMTR|nr:unnamed protein product [Zymoseptoria tritici ST99CH_1E4]
MSDSKVFTLRWGIMATGHVAGRFTRDLLTDPSSRDVSDVHHLITAIASSSGLQRAATFRDDVKAPQNVKLFGSYAEMVSDPGVDIVYIATPVSHHFQNAMMAIEAGKAVLCEKALTATASQARILAAAATTKGVFLLEAVWTRFFPLSSTVRSLVSQGVIGTVHRVIADCSLDINPPEEGGEIDTSNKLHRLLKLDLAGGAMLDLGIYPLTWIMQIMYHLQPKGHDKEKPMIVSAVNKYPTGIDETSSFILQFPRQKAMGVGMTSLRIASGVDFDFTAGPPIRIQGTNGEIQVFGPAFKPKSIRVITKDGNGPAQVQTDEFPIPRDESRENWGHGLFWEADECARCIRDGKLESEILPPDESVLMMEIMEKVVNDGGVKYPDTITGDNYHAH